MVDTGDDGNTPARFPKNFPDDVCRYPLVSFRIPLRECLARRPARQFRRDTIIV
jgi:hypothetical protein